MAQEENCSSWNMHDKSHWHGMWIIISPESKPAATLAAREVATTALAVFWTDETAWDGGRYLSTFEAAVFRLPAMSVVTPASTVTLHTSHTSFQSQNVYFNAETSSLPWKSKLRNVWGQWKVQHLLSPCTPLTAQSMGLPNSCTQHVICAQRAHDGSQQSSSVVSLKGNYLSVVPAFFDSQLRVLSSLFVHPSTWLARCPVVNITQCVWCYRTTHMLLHAGQQWQQVIM